MLFDHQLPVLPVKLVMFQCMFHSLSEVAMRRTKTYDVFLYRILRKKRPKYVFSSFSADAM